MQTYIALLRGINVGGKNRLPMQELRALLTELGAQNVNTYIQSGNVVFQSDEADPSRLEDQIAAAIDADHGFRPQVMLLERAAFEQAIAANPFPEADAAPRSVHLYFLAQKPDHPDRDALENERKESERFQLIDDVFYLHAPDGIGRSKLAAKAERLLGVPATARNWRTVGKIREMVGEYE